MNDVRKKIKQDQVYITPGPITKSEEDDQSQGTLFTESEIEAIDDEIEENFMKGEMTMNNQIQ